VGACFLPVHLSVSAVIVLAAIGAQEEGKSRWGATRGMAQSGVVTGTNPGAGSKEAQDAAEEEGEINEDSKDKEGKTTSDIEAE